MQTDQNCMIIRSPQEEGFLESIGDCESVFHLHTMYPGPVFGASGNLREKGGWSTLYQEGANGDTPMPIPDEIVF
jgi:hypothetical protein